MDRLPVKIRLDLSTHCIETEIKRAYNKSVSQYFNSQKDKNQLEPRIEALKNALEAFDFPFLRSHYPILSGRHDKDVLLVADQNGALRIITGKEVICP